MARQFIRIEVEQDMFGYRVDVKESSSQHTAVRMPPLPSAKNLDADAATEVVRAALEMWSRYEVEQGWTEE
jgi:hypothetical protein